MRELTELPLNDMLIWSMAPPYKSNTRVFLLVTFTYDTTKQNHVSTGSSPVTGSQLKQTEHMLCLQIQVRWIDVKETSELNSSHDALDITNRL